MPSSVFVSARCFRLLNLATNPGDAIASVLAFIARDAFVRTNRRAIATMLVRLSVFLSVLLSGTGVYCDHIQCTFVHGLDG